MSNEEILIEARSEARAFVDDLKNGKFNLVRLPNTEVNYTKNLQERDNKAVMKFTETKLFDHVMHGSVYES